MQRDKNLYPLSYQHHNGLMAVLLLKKGLERKADAGVMGTFILSIWDAELRIHFIKEEVYLHPHVLQIAELMDMYEQMKTEHHQVRKMIDAIRSLQSTEALVNEFHALLEKHIRFEERIMFPFIEEHIQQEQLLALGKQLEHLESKACSDYPVKFWE